jgi:GH15 family glucan-1,4-alpha-glucosidase
VFDRAVKAVRTHKLEGPADKWEQVCDRIHDEVCEKGFDKERNTFRAAYDGHDLDASLLLLAQTGFVKPDDPRFVGTVEAIEREPAGRRLRAALPTPTSRRRAAPGEGAFLACSFWLADAYCLDRPHGDAETLFKRLLASATISACSPRSTTRRRRQSATSRRPSATSR